MHIQSKHHLSNTLNILILVALLSGCVAGLKGETYTREDARTPQKVEFGVIVAVKAVVIEGTRSQIGAAVGSILGGIAASNASKGGDLSTTIGATAGGVLGHMAEERFTRAQALEITVRKENGDLISVVQEVDDIKEFKADDKIRILTLNGVTRISL